MNDVTQILSRIEDGDGKAAEELLPLVYVELRKLAAQKMAQEEPGHTLRGTPLVHEARIRLVDVAMGQRDPRSLSGAGTWHDMGLLDRFLTGERKSLEPGIAPLTCRISRSRSLSEVFANPWTQKRFCMHP